MTVILGPEVNQLHDWPLFYHRTVLLSVEKARNAPTKLFVVKVSALRDPVRRSLPKYGEQSALPRRIFDYPRQHGLAASDENLLGEFGAGSD